MGLYLLCLFAINTNTMADSNNIRYMKSSWVAFLSNHFPFMESQISEKNKWAQQWVIYEKN